MRKIVSALSVTLAALLSVAYTPSTLLLAQPSSNVTVFASGLAGPRGLKFGPDGALYVAEAGSGGTTSTSGLCRQVFAPLGHYTNGNTARISKIDSAGNRTTVASGLPSAQDATGSVIGVADVAFLNGNLYAVLAGGGCSHGNIATPNSVISVDTTTGYWKVIANLSGFVRSNPVQYPSPGDYEPDGNFYSLIGSGNLLYTVEANHGQVISIAPNGDRAEVADISLATGHSVPTSIAAKDGNFYVGNLGRFPIVPDSSVILTLSNTASANPVPGLDPQTAKAYKVIGSRAGFTTVVAVAFGPDGLLYALELSAAPGYPSGGQGKVVRLAASGQVEDVATGLTVPTGMTFGPDGKLYVSNLGAAPAGAGQIVRIDLP